jgi:osmotically inducible protein OsmC
LFRSAYSFLSRFEEGKGTNPEELLGAAHAACFSMALSSLLEKNGFKPVKITTQSSVYIEKVDGDFGITKILLNTQGEVPGIDEKTFIGFASEAKINCPVSEALASTNIELIAALA